MTNLTHWLKPFLSIWQNKDNCQTEDKIPELVYKMILSKSNKKYKRVFDWINRLKIDQQTSIRLKVYASMCDDSIKVLCWCLITALN